MQNNHTYAVLNEERDYPLEKMLRSLAGLQNSYVTALFDCCRERMSEAMTRGGNTDAPVAEVDDNNINLILNFGCPPSDGTPAKSTIAIHYFKHLKAKANVMDGSVILPSAL